MASPRRELQVLALLATALGVVACTSDRSVTSPSGAARTAVVGGPAGRSLALSPFLALTDIETPRALVTFSGFSGLLGQPLSAEPTCAAGYSGTLLHQSHSCSIRGASVTGEARADLGSGIVGAASSVIISPLGGLHLNAGEVVTFLATAGDWYRLSFTPLNATATPSSVAVWATIDGTIDTKFGTWPGSPSRFGFTHGSRADLIMSLGLTSIPLTWVSQGSVQVRLDDVDTFGGATLARSGYTNFLTVADGGAAMRNGLAVSPITPLSGDMLVALTLISQSFFLNQTPFDFTYFGATDDIDFLNTSRLASVQVFDSDGTDISPFVAVRVDGGRYLPTGGVHPPETAISQLLTAVLALAPHPFQTPLATLLRNALRSMESGRSPAACGPLRAFVSQLNAGSERELAAGTAHAWVAQAEHIQRTLDCAREG